MVTKIEVNGKKLSDLKHHIDKMANFANYFRSEKVSKKYLKAIQILRDELFEAVDVDD